MISRRSLIVASVVGAFAFAGAAFRYPRGGAVLVDFERGYEEAFVRGFHPRERVEGKFFRRTDDASYVELRHLPPKGTIRVEARLRTIRPEGGALPNLAFTANGVTVHRAVALPGVVTYHFEFPSTSKRLSLGIESDTFEAAGGRKLGVQVLGIRLKLPEEIPSFEEPALWMALSSVLLLGAGLASGLSFPISALAAAALTLPLLYLLGLQGVRFSTYPREVALLAASTLTREKVFRLLYDQGLLSDDRMNLLRSWRRSGFSIDNDLYLHPSDSQALETLCRYIVRCPVSLQRLHYDTKSKFVLYQPRSKTRKAELLNPLEFLARVLIHVPEPTQRSILYYGHYARRGRKNSRDRPSPVATRPPRLTSRCHSFRRTRVPCNLVTHPAPREFPWLPRSQLDLIS